jgi:probable HAF family extracellular repeat protein
MQKCQKEINNISIDPSIDPELKKQMIDDLYLQMIESKKILPLGNLGGEDKFYSCATDINNSKQIVGVSEVNIKKNRYYCRHAFLWDKVAMFDLGTLEQDQDSEALAINSQGDVIGRSGGIYWLQDIQRALIWTRQTGMVDLNTHLTQNDWHFA